MFTPEDRLDHLDEDIGRCRRRILAIDQASPSRVANETELVTERVRVFNELHQLERERAELVAEQIALAEGFLA